MTTQSIPAHDARGTALTRDFSLRLDVPERRTLVWLNAGILGLAVLAAWRKFDRFGMEYLPIGAALIAVTAGANLIYLACRGNLRIAGASMVASGACSIGVGAVMTGGLSGPTPAFALLLPLAGVSLIGNGAWRVGLAALLLVVGALLVGHLTGVLPDGPLTGDLLRTSQFVCVILTALLATFIASRFARIYSDQIEVNQRAAHTDALTGIPNRLALDEALLREVGRTIRTNTWLTLIVCDIDHFKRYNDRNGHPAGDACLIAVAQALRGCARRPLDVVGRYGGEEFLMVLPETTGAGARTMARRIRDSVAALQLPLGPDLPRHVSVTVGCLSVEGHAIRSIDSLIRGADDAMYAGKASGRRRATGTTIWHLPGSARRPGRTEEWSVPPTTKRQPPTATLVQNLAGDIAPTLEPRSAS